MEHEAVGFTTDEVASAVQSGQALTAWGDLVHISLSDPSGAGVRCTYGPLDGPVCTQAVLRVGEATHLWVTGATRDPGCVWCSCVEADVRDHDGAVVARLGFAVGDLAHSLGAWRPDAATPVRLSLWPQHLRTFPSDDAAVASRGTTPGAGYPVGSWVSDRSPAGPPVPTGTLTGRVNAVTRHKNQYTGDDFAVAHVLLTTTAMSVVVPLASGTEVADGLAPGHVLEVQGRLRATYEGPAGPLVTRGRPAPWLAQVLGLAPTDATGGPPRAEAAPYKAVDCPTGHGEDLVPSPWLTPPDPQGVGRNVDTVVATGVVAAIGCGAGRALAVQVEGGGVVVLWLSSGSVDRRFPMPGPLEAIASYEDHALIASGGVAAVLDCYGNVLTRVLRPAGTTRWAVSHLALWALVERPRGDVGDGRRVSDVHRVPRSRWTGHLPPSTLDSVSDTWPVTVTGAGPPSIVLGDSSGRCAVVVLPGDGSGSRVVLTVPVHDDPVVCSPSADELPLAVLATPAGLLMTTPAGTWLDGVLVSGPFGPMGGPTSWHVLYPTLLGGVVGPPREPGTNKAVGVLRLRPDNIRWYEVQRDQAVDRARFVMDVDREDDLAWVSTHAGRGTRLCVLDLLHGTVRHQNLAEEVSVVAASARAEAVLLLLEQPLTRAHDTSGRHAVTGRPPGLLVLRRTGLGA